MIDILPQYWLILGMFLLCIEIFTGTFFALAFALSAFAMIALQWVFPNLTLIWYTTIAIYCSMSVIVSITLWKLRCTFSKSQRIDINDG